MTNLREDIREDDVICEHCGCEIGPHEQPGWHSAEWCGSTYWGKRWQLGQAVLELGRAIRSEIPWPRVRELFGETGGEQ